MSSNNQDKPKSFDLYRLAGKGVLCTVVSGCWDIGKYQFIASKYDPNTRQSTGVWRSWVSLPAMVHAARMIPFVIARGGPTHPPIKVLEYFGGSPKNGVMVGRRVELMRDNKDNKYERWPWRLILTEGEGEEDGNGAITIKKNVETRQFQMRLSDQHVGEMAAMVMMDAQQNIRAYLAALYRKSQEKRNSRYLP